jgi:hypothetical protein
MSIVNNSRMGRVLPDVEAVRSPLVDRLLALVAALGDGGIPLGDFQRETLAAVREQRGSPALETTVAAALTQQKDQVLARKSWPQRDYTIQVISISPGEVHPCHCHHNVVSTQMVLQGRVFGREYERVTRRADGLLLLRPLRESWYEPGDAMQTTEMSRNVHWFAAEDAPAAMLNFNIRGYEDETFDPRDGRPLGRRLLDPTLGAAGDGLLLAREIDVAEAYERFGGRRLADFPLPIPAAAG